MSDDTGWKCINCGNFNVRTDICPKSGKDKSFLPNKNLSTDRENSSFLDPNAPQLFIDAKTQNTVDHLLILAVAAEEAKNYEEANMYYSQVLELDSIISVAWIGIGISAGWLSSVQAQRVDEAITYIKRGVETSNSDPRWIEHAAIELILITISYTNAICKYLAEKQHEESILRRTGVPVDPIMAGLIINARIPAALEKTKLEFWQTYRPVIIRASFFSWHLSKSSNIANGIYNIINVVNNSALASEVKSGFRKDFQEIFREKEGMLPNWRPPSRKHHGK